jgi:hypothetical protein
MAAVQDVTMEYQVGVMMYLNSTKKRSWVLCGQFPTLAEACAWVERDFNTTHLVAGEEISIRAFDA